MRPGPLLVALSAALALAAAGCGGGGGEANLSQDATAKPTAATPAACKWQAGWQRLANRIKAPVYCPNWLPDPLTGQIGGQWNNIDGVDKDRSYLEGFVWQETGPGAAGGELHVNLRGYPGRTRIPKCEDTLLGGGKVRRVVIPCFSDRQPAKTVAGYRVTPYTVNQGADQWHLLYAWTYKGGLYTASEHVAPPVTFGKAQRYLDRIMSNLVLIQPARY